MKITHTDDIFHLSGAIGASDQAVLARFVEEARALPGSAQGVRLNLRGVSNFSTSAVRLWRKAKADLLKLTRGQVIVVEVSAPFINFANVSGEALDGLTVLSAFVPTECVRCHDRSEVLIDLARGVPDLRPLMPKCAKCSDKTAEAVDRDEYFACLLGL